ncbi:hypothetical protein PFICI_03789 [Pestalotiopsis fici W106-1]|uniref:Peptidase M4 C-terminal domain-containing protein n=1 Tax=Pestalotiopsis fici (strain W106-1 / CGMCC3.15140) TaxID=1229662 RepID=W3XIE8_PESFW|nr:uncharacterized protein PFICI_03789 [Pestalotiopsis fici W106-1]ETS85764.1 hypothetical protein PFICI_03789 [Pestalotiopsis fici W106-1]
MCPITPEQHLQAIADNDSLPEQFKSNATLHLQRRVVLAPSSEAISDVVVEPPSTNNVDFTWSIYTMDNKLGSEKTLPGNLVASSKSTTKSVDDVAYDKCHKSFAWTWKLFKEKFSRNSLDNNGLELRASIHYGKDKGDAAWNGDLKQILIGDGGRYATDDGRTTSPLSSCGIDVIGHELTHGVISATVPGLDPAQQGQFSKPWVNDSDVDPAFKRRMENLMSKDEKTMEQMGPGGMWYTWNQGRNMEAQTLNEHIADCFGIMVKHFSQDQTVKTGNWQIAPGWWSDDTVAKNNYTTNCLRSFDLPKSATDADQFPKKWDKNTMCFEFQWNSHFFAGIGNHAFFQAAHKFGGKTWENVGQIWYQSLTDPMFNNRDNQNYASWRDITIKHAGKLFGADGSKKMTESWQIVGL